MARTLIIALACLAAFIVGDTVQAGNCHHFFHQQAIVAPVIAQPVVLYQAGRDVELDALAEKVAQRLEQRLQLRQQPLTHPSQPLTQANVSSSVMVQHCMKCHSGATPKGGIVYDGVTNLTGDQIVEALKSVLDGSMPKDHKLPDESKGPLMEALLSLHKKD